MLYELERGLFGPTFEMIMQYEDYSRKDIVVKMQTEGEIKMRSIEEGAHQILKMAGRVSLLLFRGVHKTIKWLLS